MQIEEGTVFNLRHSTETSGGENGSSTQQIAIFDLGGRPVSVKLGAPIVLQEGDKVRVAGSVKRGIFVARGYHNISRNCWGVGPRWAYVILGIPFLLFLGAGLWLMWEGYQNMIAERMLK
jgi:hypothetical protein